MILVAEPTYADAEHAAVNGAILCAIRQACGPAGHTCPNLEAVACADRLPQSLARTVRRDLGY